MALLVISPQTALADYNFEPDGTAWNGQKIYLSPARHEDTGGRGECQSASENELAFFAAYDAANGPFYNDVYDPDNPYSNLRKRGYKVQISTGTISSAIANSNAWGATRHVANHSNARTETCKTTNAAVHGTNGIYRSGSTLGQDLTAKLTQTIGVDSGRRSPGTNDYTCYNPGHPCTAIDLGELRETNAPAAYMETEFHTWNTRVNWLYDSQTWAWRFGLAVDMHLGYPR